MRTFKAALDTFGTKYEKRIALDGMNVDMGTRGSCINIDNKAS